MTLEGRAKRVRIYLNEGDKVGDQTADTAVLTLPSTARTRPEPPSSGPSRASAGTARSTPRAGRRGPGAPDGHRVDRLGGARRAAAAPGEEARPARAHHRRSDRDRPLRALSGSPRLESSDRGQRHVPRRHRRGAPGAGSPGRGAASRARLPGRSRHRRKGSGGDHQQLRPGHPRRPHRPDGAVTQPGGSRAPRRARAARQPAEDRRRDHDSAPGDRARHDATPRGRADHGSATSEAPAGGGPGRWAGRDRQSSRSAPHGRRGLLAKPARA